MSAVSHTYDIVTADRDCTGVAQASVVKLVSFYVKHGIQKMRHTKLILCSPAHSPPLFVGAIRDGQFIIRIEVAEGGTYRVHLCKTMKKRSIIYICIINKCIYNTYNTNKFDRN